MEGRGQEGTGGTPSEGVGITDDNIARHVVPLPHDERPITHVEINSWIKNRIDQGKSTEVSQAQKDQIKDLIRRFEVSHGFQYSDYLNSVKIVAVGPSVETHMVRGQLAHLGLSESKIYIPTGLFRYLSLPEISAIVLHELVEYSSWKKSYDSAKLSGYKSSIGTYRFENSFNIDKYHDEAIRTELLFYEVNRIARPNYRAKIVAAGAYEHMKLWNQLDVLERNLKGAIDLLGPEKVRELNETTDLRKMRYSEERRYLSLKSELIDLSKKTIELHEHLAVLAGSKDKIDKITARVRNGESVDTAAQTVLYGVDARAPPTRENLNVYTETGRPSYGRLSELYMSVDTLTEAIELFFKDDGIRRSIIVGSFHANRDTEIFINNVPTHLKPIIEQMVKTVLETGVEDIWDFVKRTHETYMSTKLRKTQEIAKDVRLGK